MRTPERVAGVGTVAAIAAARLALAAVAFGVPRAAEPPSRGGDPRRDRPRRRDIVARPRAIRRAIRTARHLLRPTLACRLSDFEQVGAARFHLALDGVVNRRRVRAASLFGHICWQARHHLGARRPFVAQPPLDLGSVRASQWKLAHTSVDLSSRLGYDRARLGHGAGSRASLAIGIIVHRRWGGQPGGQRGEQAREREDRRRRAERKGLRQQA